MSLLAWIINDELKILCLWHNLKRYGVILFEFTYLRKLRKILFRTAREWKVEHDKLKEM